MNLNQESTLTRVWLLGCLKELSLLVNIQKGKASLERRPDHRNIIKATLRAGNLHGCDRDSPISLSLSLSVQIWWWEDWPNLSNMLYSIQRGLRKEQNLEGSVVGSRYSFCVVCTCSMYLRSCYFSLQEIAVFAKVVVSRQKMTFQYSVN